ncbi:hypothetical protein NP233_g5539 [Leucocoprinus birnbaumii]|uniref:HTH TFE/IIEalpha-type domain-containing protein n=1 Tax=Leucocoprinus birnbaumii TaxID=56174 RepID=A0AAD5YRS9_9AGAR|nr:hypothetical protein NP233_g5539 [Leucocoprinus birnbaumii]
MDQLARHPVLKDDDLAGRMGLQPKELNKVIAVLNNDCLVKVYRQNELKEGAQRSVGKQYYYIDYQHFCNVVKWRIAKMRHIIDSSLRNELDNKGYVCTLCKQSYSPLDVDKLMDFMRGMMVCEICHAEVVDNENAESVQGSKDRMQRFNHQMRFIREGLQKSEAMVLPAFDVAAFVKTHFTDSESKKLPNGTSTSSGLKIAGANGSSTNQDEGIGIMMAMDKDESTQRQERAAEAELKRQQNALPAWHLKSTITGDLTALGIEESRRAEQAAAAAQAAAGGTGVGGVSGFGGGNDEILRGLGVLGGSSSRGVNGASGGGTASAGDTATNGTVEDEKPKVGNDEADYYDQYYASLAASTTVSAVPTPTAGTLSSESGDYSYTIEDDGEEDRKPNIEYLDSLNEYRKRSRSKDDVDGVANGSRKVGKTSSEMSASASISASMIGVNGIGTPDEEVKDVGMDEGGGDAVYANGFADTADSADTGDDPIVYVNGNPVPYSRVTEEDHELMTPDEYTAYFDVMQSMS